MSIASDKIMQANLKKAGLYTGVIDGIIGPATFQALAEFGTDGKANDYIGVQMAKWFPIGNISGRDRTISWLSHGCAESKLRPIAESLDYSVEALIDNFGRHRISIADAQKYGRAPGRPADQQAIGNIIYGGEFGKRDLGNLTWGDGWAHRGMGIIQNTGRTSHRESGKRVGLDLENRPELLLTIEGAVAGSVGFWMWKGINAIIDKPGDTTEEETLKINGGRNGLAHRKEAKARYRSIWPAG